MARVRLGINCKLYYNAGSYATPTWTEIAPVKDLDVTLIMSETDNTTRAEGGAIASEPTLLGMEVTGMIRHDDEDAGFLVMDNAFFQRTAKEYLVHNAANTSENSRGFRSYMKIFNWNQSQGNDAVLYQAFTLKPTISPTAAETMIRRANVEGGTLAFVAIDAANTTPA